MATASSFASSLRSRLSPFLQSLRTRSQPLVQRASDRGRLAIRRWGAPVVILAGAYQFIDPTVTAQYRLVVAAQLDPLLEWRSDRVDGPRKKQLLAHYGVPRGGAVLELLPGAGGVFSSLVLKPEERAYQSPLHWTGIDLHSTHWKAGRGQQSAAQHAGVPVTHMEFHSCAAEQKPMVELLKEIPDGSMNYVLAVHGLSPIFNASTVTHATYATSAASHTTPTTTATPSSPDAELTLLLSEVHRILRPGGRFIFSDIGMYTPGTLAKAEQDVANLTHIPLPTGRLAPLPLAQSLPGAGFQEAHLEQWPTTEVEGRNVRKGVKVLKVVEKEGVVQLEGLRGLKPHVVGIATKAQDANAPKNANQLLERSLGNLFGRTR